MVVANETPLSIGKVTLTVHDLDAVGDFYERVIGLHRHARTADSLSLGNGSAVLLELVRDPSARRSTPREAGLFHTAFLLPSRPDLGAFLHHMASLGLRLDGAADHIVSEAVYLHDPEGNGVEVYRDRPGDTWTWQNGHLDLRNDPLDFNGILADGAETPWTGVPPGSLVGHVHLQVGEIAAAEAFYRDTLGFEVTCRMPRAVFYSSGDYHHHLATNTWNSQGAGIRAMPSTGLSEVEIVRNTARSGAALPAGRFVDPWRTVLNFVEN